jgi:hypothetical protein
MANDKKNWNELEHDEKLQLLRSRSIEALADEYYSPEEAQNVFPQFLAEERELWNPDNLGKVERTGDAPRKDIIIGSWRDLDRAEALLELIDNSIDAWLRRRHKYPAKTAKTLTIYIDVDEEKGQLTYEDNAGGISRDNIENLVIPGYSETVDLEPTIGSYKTGGKKAIFKLATEANIRTRYLNPAGTGDVALQIHLDHAWLAAQTDYEFPYYVMKKPDIELGQTLYTFRLRDTWKSSEVFDKITTEIRRTYTLLILRHPIEIYFNNREKPLAPLEELYRFSGTNGKDTDLRPQRVNFLAKLPWQGKEYEVRIEMIFGCRTTSSEIKGEDGWGIDLYGNDRLFVLRDPDQVIDWYNFPRGPARHLMRGLINVHGPNVFIPWDVHKRHLNADREIVGLLRTNRLIRMFIDQWTAAYQKVARSDVKNLIKAAVEPWSAKKDLNVLYDNNIPLGGGKQREVKWPAGVHTPKVALMKKPGDKTVTIKIPVTKAEFRELCTRFEIEGAFEDTATQKALGEAIKEEVLVP